VTAAEAPFSLALVVATRARLPHVAARLPLWIRSGFDEMILVDASYDPAGREELRRLCAQCGARYVEVPRTLRDLRSLQRNRGAAAATTTWVLFQDDDDDVPLRIDKAALARDAAGKDWLVGPAGEHIVFHRRAAFLAFGGYPEDMVAAEDMIMSNRARGHGRGGLHGNWYEGAVTPKAPREDALGRARNAFWYGFTVFLFLLRTPRPRPVLIGDARRVLRFALLVTRGELRAGVYFLVAAFARLLSPLHALRVRLRSGPAAMRREPLHGWQGLR